MTVTTCNLMVTVNSLILTKCISIVTINKMTVTTCNLMVTINALIVTKYRYMVTIIK